MKAAARTILAVTAGMLVALALVIAVEFFSSIVHPIPPDFKGTIPDHVRRYPDWVLGVVVLMWGVTIVAATWVASRLGNLAAALIVVALLAWALTFNLTKLPYTMWFKVVMFSAFPIACFLGVWYGKRRVSGPAGAWTASESRSQG